MTRSSVQFSTYCSQEQVLALLCLVESLYEQNNGSWELTVYTTHPLVRRVIEQIPRPELKVAWVKSPVSPQQIIQRQKRHFPGQSVVYAAPKIYFFNAPWEARPNRAESWFSEDDLLYQYLPVDAEAPCYEVDTQRWLYAHNLPSEPLQSVATNCLLGPGGPICAIYFKQINLIQPNAIALSLISNTTNQNLSLAVLPYIIQTNRAWIWLFGVEPEFQNDSDVQKITGDEALFVFGKGQQVAQNWFKDGWSTLHQGWFIHYKEAVDEQPIQSRWPPPVSRDYEVHIQSSALTPVRVTAIVSTYNASQYFRGCMDDLVDQTLFKQGLLEILVIDSASLESEGDTVLEYIGRHPNIRYYRTASREGLYTAWNRGIDLARGQYLTNANTDDRHHPRAFEVMANYLDLHPEAGLLYSQIFMTHVPNQAWAERTPHKLLDPYKPTRSVLSQIDIIGPQPMWRKRLHEQAGFFDSRYTISGDYEMWLRFEEITAIHKLPEITGLFLIREDSIEHSNLQLCAQETKAINWNWRHWHPSSKAG